MNLEAGQKVYVQCGDLFYHGLIDMVDEEFLHLENADLFVVDNAGDLNPTAIHSRDMAIRRDKIDAAIEGGDQDDAS